MKTYAWWTIVQSVVKYEVIWNVMKSTPKDEDSDDSEDELQSTTDAGTLESANMTSMDGRDSSEIP